MAPDYDASLLLLRQRAGIVWRVKVPRHKNNDTDWAGNHLRGHLPGSWSARDRRSSSERRRRLWWSLLYGSFNPRRRRPSRRLTDFRYQSVDWHSAHLFAVALGILLLSVADAFLTLTLLAGGAIEMNPLMAMMVNRSAAAFAAVKMGLTGTSVLLMVILARYRFMRVIRVEFVMYALLILYVALLAYEFWLLPAVVGAVEL